MGVECCNAGSEENLNMETMSGRQSIIEQNALRYKVKIEEDEYSFKNEAYNRLRS